MPVVSYISISSKPPLVGVACSLGNFTARLASCSGAFTLCIVGRSMAGPMSYLAEHSGREVDDKLVAAGLKHRPGRLVPAPVVVGSSAVLECTLHSKRRAGDHHLLVGKVQTAYASQDFVSYWRFRSYEPILYTGWRHGLSTYRPRRA